MLKFERNGLTVHSVSGMVDPEAASAHVTVLDQTTGLALAQASITAEIELSGSNDGSATGLQACTGECDNDGQCGSGLRCFQRDNGEKIPGCKGNGGGPDWDYCYGAIESDALALLSTLGGFSRTLYGPFRDAPEGRATSVSPLSRRGSAKPRALRRRHTYSSSSA